MSQRLTDVDVPWEALAETVSLALSQWVVGPRGIVPSTQASLQPECPMSYELLRSSAM
jgi:hypothetical protein